MRQVTLEHEGLAQALRACNMRTDYYVVSPNSRACIHVACALLRMAQALGPDPLVGRFYIKIYIRFEEGR